MTPSSSEFLDAVRSLVAQAARPALPFDERAVLLNRMIASIDGCDDVELNNAVSNLIPALQAEDPYSGGIVAMALGALIESGADPLMVCQPLRAAATKRMRDATHFARTWSAGDPGAGDGKLFMEGRHAQLGQIIVTPESIQPWAARDPAGARAWSRLDDWFLPLMAVARFNKECQDQIQRDVDLRKSLDDLIAADRCICVGLGCGNSNAGVHVDQLMRGGGLPAFTDEKPAQRKRGPVATASDLFDDISEFLCKYCDRPDVVMRVEILFEPEPVTLKVVRHIRDPAMLFDTSRDTAQQLSEAELAFVKAKAAELFALTQQWEVKQLNTTLSVYQDGSWSVGGSSRKR